MKRPRRPFLAAASCFCHRHENFTAMNPGSVSIPKEGSAHSFMVWENGLFRWKNLEDGSTYREETL